MLWRDSTAGRGSAPARGRPFEQLELPGELKRAVIVHRGELTPEYEYLKAHLG